MFEAEQAHIEEQIKAFCAQQGLPEPNLLWSWIPFSGQWGISTSFFQLASQEARQGKKVVVPQRAQELALAVAQFLGQPDGFARIEAVRGYLNLYYSTSKFAQRVVFQVLTQGADFGRGASLGDPQSIPCGPFAFGHSG